jgi:hypothetical protein
MYKLTIIYLIGFLALGLLSTAYASGAETRSSVSKNKLEKATFAGGCFWCMQPPFDKLDGVISTTVGYCGGKEENPTYKQVSAGNTGHAELTPGPSIGRRSFTIMKSKKDWLRLQRKS